MKKTITSHDLKNLVNEAHAQVKDLKGGKNANYIPFLRSEERRVGKE